MNIFWLFGVLAVAVSNTHSSNPGLQMRLTEHGMRYAIDTAVDILKTDLTTKVIDESGQSGHVSWRVYELRVTKADFGNYQLLPVAGTGLKIQMSGISINAGGKLYYKYKRGFIKISDTMGFNAEISNMQADLTLAIGADLKGHPTIDLNACYASVGGIHLKFHAKFGWLYNLLVKILEGKIKDAFSKMLCNLAREEIENKAKSELATFPVIKKIDDVAEIDYSLTKSPLFTTEYMDVFLKGEFKPVATVESSSLPVPPLNPPSSADRMLYFWLSDYTVNTAGKVYHDAEKLKGHLEAWDSDVPEVKKYLNTKMVALLVPQLYKMYPNVPMGLDIISFAPPNMVINVNDVAINLFATTTFKVKDQTIKDVFVVQFSITCSAKVGNRENNITAEIEKFDYSSKVVKSYIGDIKIPFDNPIFKTIIDMGIISKARPILAKGFPLPKIGDVSFKNFELLLQKDFIEIGTDVECTKKMSTD